MSDLKVEVVESISSVNRNMWNNFVIHNPILKTTSFFHSYEWLKTIEDGLCFQAKHIIVRDDKNIKGIFPNFIQKIPKVPFKKMRSLHTGSGGANYGGPVVYRKKERRILDLLFKKTSEICGRDITIMSHSIICFNIDYIRYAEYFIKNEYRPYFASTFLFDLTQDEELLKNKMDKRRRRNLQRGLESDHQIKDIEINEPNLRNFYRLYRITILRVKGRLLPFSFFKSMMSNLSEKIKIFSVMVEGREVGEMLFLLDKEKGYLHYYMNAVDESDFKHYPNELINWHVMKWGKANGYKIYGFGGAPASFESSLLQFKEEFGGQILPIIYWNKYFFPWKGSIIDILKPIYRTYLSLASESPR